MTDRKPTWEELPEELKAKVIKDWDERTASGILRGLDHAAHYRFLLWLAKEYETTLEIIISEEEEV